MPTHTQNKEAIQAQKVSGVSEAEAKNAIIALRLLSEDTEASSSVKGEATDLYRQLSQNIANSVAREDLMRRATSLANRA